MPSIDPTTPKGFDHALDQAKDALDADEYREALGYYLALAEYEAGEREHRPSASNPPTRAQQ